MDITQILNQAEDFIAADGDVSRDYYLVQISSQTRYTVLTEGSLAQARFRLFNILGANYRDTGTHQTSDVYRIVTAEELSEYKSIADANYRLSYQGNTRSGELDRSVDWNDATQFPRVH